VFRKNAAGVTNRKSGGEWRVEVSDTASSHIGPNHDVIVLSGDCVRNKAYREAQKKRAVARFLLSPRLLPAAGTFMVGKPSIGSNSIVTRGNLTSYPEGYLRRRRSIGDR
jgi:hypothetical protein